MTELKNHSGLRFIKNFKYTNNSANISIDFAEKQIYKKSLENFKFIRKQTVFKSFKIRIEINSKINNPELFLESIHFFASTIPISDKIVFILCL